MANVATDVFMLVSFYQWTALHIAARDGRDYIAECLVKANVNIQDENGVSVPVLV